MWSHPKAQPSCNVALVTTGKFILVGHDPEPCTDLMKWAYWFETADRRVAHNSPLPNVSISTVFLGLDHQFGKGPPLIFETMIFGGKHDGWTERCSTWDQAVAMHARAVNMVQETASSPAKRKKKIDEESS